MLSEKGRDLLQDNMEDRLYLLEAGEEIFKDAVIKHVLKIDPDAEEDTALMDEIKEEIELFIAED